MRGVAGLLVVRIMILMGKFNNTKPNIKCIRKFFSHLKTLIFYKYSNSNFHGLKLVKFFQLDNLSRHHSSSENISYHF